MVQTPAQKENFVSLTTDAWKTEPDGDAYNQWRDTIIIPAYGEVKVWIRFPHLPKKYDLNGKTVFHVSRRRPPRIGASGCTRMRTWRPTW